MLKRILRAAYRFFNNPHQFFLLLYAAIKKFWPLPKHPVRKRMNGILFEFNCALYPMVRDMYVGGYEVAIAQSMKSILKERDVFIDVGANIGYFSAIGAGLIGKTGQVHSFEPIPGHFQALQKMAGMNPDHRISVNRCGLGEKRGSVPIKVSLKNIGFNTMVSGLAETGNENRETVEATVCRLDDYIEENAIDKISLIKIDTEGWEFFVLRGLSKWFENIRHRPAIICEIKPSAYPLIRHTLVELAGYMRLFNYKAYDLINRRKEIDITKLTFTTNVLFRSS